MMPWLLSLKVLLVCFLAVITTTVWNEALTAKLPWNRFEGKVVTESQFYLSGGGKSQWHEAELTNHSTAFIGPSKSQPVYGGLSVCATRGSYCSLQQCLFDPNWWESGRQTHYRKISSVCWKSTDTSFPTLNKWKYIFSFQRLIGTCNSFRCTGAEKHFRASQVICL